MRIGRIAGVLLLAAGVVGAQTPPLVGWWEAVLPGLMAQRLELHVTLTPTGALDGAFNSIDQGGARFPASTLQQKGNTVKIAAGAIHASFNGQLSPDGDTLTGTWTQNKAQTPLTFHRAAGPLALARPQEPQPPFPYRSEDVRVTSVGGIQLAGTLTEPHTQPQAGFPAVILIAGSGPNIRDEDVAGHKIFLVLSDYLTRRGWAVLRMDKRGVGLSQGDAATATTADYAKDVAAELDYLKSRPDIDANHIGLIGHSEGGLIAPMVASAHPEVAFVVLMAGPGERGDAEVVAQLRAIDLAAGVPAVNVDAAVDAEWAILRAVEEAPTPAGVPAALQAAEAAGKIPKMNYQAQMGVLASPWYWDYLLLDPTPYLQKLQCPVLALIGSKDVQVPAAENLPLLRRALEGDPRAQVVELPGLNHLFQTADTGLPAEYGRISETLAPAALARIGDWMQQTLDSQ